MLFEQQQHQEDCVDNIVSVLRGAVGSERDGLRGLEAGGLRRALQDLQRERKIKRDGLVDRLRLDVLMETGTGKTFTYLKTIFELHARFGANKFIIVLPRIAIKLGVIQNIKLTDAYFYQQYKKHLNYIDYPRDGLSRVLQDFVNSDDLMVLVTTSSAFHSARTRINRRHENLVGGVTVWDEIVAKKPVVIVDEPHLLKGTQTTFYLQQVESLFIRFGATYPPDKEVEHKLGNVVYELDSIDAFNQQLVKQINVSTVFANSAVSSLKVFAIHAGSRAKNFEVAYNINQQLHTARIYLQQDIGAVTKLPDYVGEVVTRISAKKIHTRSGRTLEPSVGNYALNSDEIKIMVRHTIELHFAKEQERFAQGIKTLSLFFIPNIADFRGDDARIKIIFEEEYKKIRKRVLRNTTNPAYKEYLNADYEGGELRVHEGYFSGDRGTAEEKEQEAVDIILNDKEKLLSLGEPLRFIFSVWALQEGWDNPNIFNICKLAPTNADVKRRQQVGRGLRIAVNQGGRRLTHTFLGENEGAFYQTNALHVVVSEHEHDFIQHIQREIVESSFALAGDVLTEDQLDTKKITRREIGHLFSVLEENGVLRYRAETQDYLVLKPILEFLEANRDKFDPNYISDAQFAHICAVFAAGAVSPVVNSNEKSPMVTVRPNKWREFKELWETLNRKSRLVYRDIDEDKIIARISDAFADSDMKKAMTVIVEEILRGDAVEKTKEERAPSFAATEAEKFQRFKRKELPQFIVKFAEDKNLPLQFLLKLFARIDLQKFHSNVGEAQQELVELVGEYIHQLIIDSVDYQFGETAVYGNELQDSAKKLLNNGKFPHTKFGRHMDPESVPHASYLYDLIAYDSAIEKDSIESDPLENLDAREVVVFAKLPPINIPTPYKTYNPDFAYLISGTRGNRLFLVVETKGYARKHNIPAPEQNKINYAEKFFETLQKQLPKGVAIRYATRLNNTALSTLLGEAQSYKS